MKKKWLIAQLICMYSLQIIFIALCFIGDGSADNIINICVWLFYGFIVLTVVFIVVNIVYSIGIYSKKLLPGERQNVFSDIMTIKLALIPYYIINFIIWVIIGLVSLIPFVFIFLGWILWIVIILGMFFTYITMLSTSSYIIMQILVLYKTKNISLIECIIHIILQFIYVADVIDVVYLSARFKKTFLSPAPPPPNYYK